MVSATLPTVIPAPSVLPRGFVRNLNDPIAGHAGGSRATTPLAAERACGPNRAAPTA